MNSRIASTLISATLFIAASIPSQAAVDFSPIIEKVGPGVVSVTITQKQSAQDLRQQQIPEFFRQFFGDQLMPNAQPQEKTGYGSAFFISQDGYLLTNHHVVDGASNITITLNDRREIDARVIGSDKRTDVAVLKVEGKGFPALKLGNADALKVGEPVLAIGSPFGFDYSASAGIVSAKSRTMTDETSVPFIQTDVALNPGNSGGPLFNQRGEVVGINSRIFSGTGGSMGVSFSIPIDVAIDVADQLKTKGHVVRSFMGVLLQEVDRNLATAYGLSKPQGALITRVPADTPASKAGLRPGDLVLSVNNDQVLRSSDLVTAVSRLKPATQVKLGILRNGQRRDVRVTLGTAPDNTPAQRAEKASSVAPSNQAMALKVGMQLRDLTAQEEARLGKKGVVITSVSRSGFAANAKLSSGDLITKVDGKDINDMKDFVKVMQGIKNKKIVTVSIERRGVPAIIGLQVD